MKVFSLHGATSHLVMRCYSSGDSREIQKYGSFSPLVAGNSKLNFMAKCGKRRFSKQRRAVFSCFRAFLRQLRRDLLLIFIVLGVIVGFVVGAAVNGLVGRIIDPEDKATILVLIGFPGELFMNMLKMLILPLIVASLVCALSTLDKKAAGKVGRRTVLYYLATTFLAVILGILLVLTIRPGDSGEGAKKDIRREPHRNLDSFLDLIRWGRSFPRMQ